jgi:zinc transport system ATP-binding protein
MAHDHSAHDHCAHGATPAPQPQNALLSARGVSLSRHGRRVLDHVDLDVVPGEIVTLIGPNGAGKTTLVRVLLALERPDQGTIERRADLRIGYVPQRFELDQTIPLTVGRFLGLAQSLTHTDTMARLDELGAKHLIDRQMATLSGGETQRVLLARALVRDPHLIALDEPTRGIDFEGEGEFYDLIETLRSRRSCSILLISHDLHIVMARSDRVICLNRHICCSGVPRAVAQTREFQHLFGAGHAERLGIYVHQHDHGHGMDGAPISPPR